jgi:hypothetical protein
VALPVSFERSKMGFLGVYKAVYDYVPQGESELAITEGDILYVLEKSGEDDWWRAKKKAKGDDDDEPVGLIPNNYIEEVCVSKQKCLGLGVVAMRKLLLFLWPPLFAMMLCGFSRHAT